jgi:hypothetical protein
VSFAVAARDKDISGDREYWQAARRRHRRAGRLRGCRRTCRGRLLRHSCKAPLARHLADRLGETDGTGGGGVSARVPGVWRRHPTDRVHHRTRAHPQNQGPSARSSRTWANHSNRLWCQPPEARPPTGASSCKSMMSGTSFRRRPKSCPRSTSTATDRRRKRGVEAPGTAD